MTGVSTKTINLMASSLIWLIAQSNCSANADGFPNFRGNAISSAKTSEVQGMRMRLLSDANFPPFSFQDANGLQKGIAVELARSACQSLKATCEIKLLPFDKLLPAMERNEGDMIISGLRASAELAAKVDMTRAFYVSSGRFVIPKNSKIGDASTTTLAGRNLGYVKNSTHGLFIEKYYSRAALKPFDTAGEMLEFLRTGALDAAFGDTLQIGFWLKGSMSAECCTELGRPFMDRETFSQNLVFVLPRERQALRQAFDQALDKLEDEGTTAAIFNRYAPMPLW
jgi:polar amino acid transport system substrate-binding protein